MSRVAVVCLVLLLALVVPTAAQEGEVDPAASFYVLRLGPPTDPTDPRAQWCYLEFGSPSGDQVPTWAQREGSQVIARVKVSRSGFASVLVRRRVVEPIQREEVWHLRGLQVKKLLAGEEVGGLAQVRVVEGEKERRWRSRFVLLPESQDGPGHAERYQALLASKFQRSQLSPTAPVRTEDGWLPFSRVNYEQVFLDPHERESTSTGARPRPLFAQTRRDLGPLLGPLLKVAFGALGFLFLVGWLGARRSEVASRINAVPVAEPAGVQISRLEDADALTRRTQELYDTVELTERFDENLAAFKTGLAQLRWLTALEESTTVGHVSFGRTPKAERETPLEQTVSAHGLLDPSQTLGRTAELSAERTIQVKDLFGGETPTERTIQAQDLFGGETPTERTIQAQDLFGGETPTERTIQAQDLFGGETPTERTIQAQDLFGGETPTERTLQAQDLFGGETPTERTIQAQDLFGGETPTERTIQAQDLFGGETPTERTLQAQDLFGGETPTERTIQAQDLFGGETPTERTTQAQDLFTPDAPLESPTERTIQARDLFGRDAPLEAPTERTIQARDLFGRDVPPEAPTERTANARDLFGRDAPLEAPTERTIQARDLFGRDAPLEAPTERTVNARDLFGRDATLEVPAPPETPTREAPTERTVNARDLFGQPIHWTEDAPETPSWLNAPLDKGLFGGAGGDA